MCALSVVEKFFNAWRSTGKVEWKFFSNDFVFVGPSAKVNAEAWLRNSDEELPMEDIVVNETISMGDSVVLLFEGVDPIALLKYRTAWFFMVKEGKIFRITEVRQIIQA